MLAKDPDITRLSIPNGQNPFELSAEKVFIWEENDQRIYLLEGQVKFVQDDYEIDGQHMVLWLDQTQAKRRQPFRVTLYASGLPSQAVQVKTQDKKRIAAQAVLGSFYAEALAKLKALENNRSMSETAIYKQALRARTSTSQKMEEQPDLLPTQGGGGMNGIQQALELAQGTNRDPANPPASPALEIQGVIPIPLVETRTIFLSPRSSQPISIRSDVINGERQTSITGGIKLLVNFTTGSIAQMDLEADEVLVWKKEGETSSSVEAMQSPDGLRGNDPIEVYLSGNVTIRLTQAKEDATINKVFRADRVYYDVQNHRAVAVNGDLEFTKLGFENPGRFSAERILQLAENEWKLENANLHASRLTSDPGFSIGIRSADVYKRDPRERRSILGLPFRDRFTGEIEEETPLYLDATSVTPEIRGFPFFWLPRYRTQVNDPLGPFQGFGFRNDRISGTQIFLTWDLLDLFGITKYEGEKWNLLTDYLTKRGPAIGTNYSLTSDTMLGYKAPFTTLVKWYYLQDKGRDVLGGIRESDFVPPGDRSRFLFRHQQQFDDNFSIQAQAAYLTDRNFFEAFWKLDYDFGPNQETFVYGKYTDRNYAFTLLSQVNWERPWVTQTSWLPKAEGYLIGQSFFDRFTYHAWGSAGYANFHYARQFPNEFPFGIDGGRPAPEVDVNTTRLDLMQQLALPLKVGPVNVVPYGVLDVAYYTNRNDGTAKERLYGGGGVRASIPFSKLYKEPESDLFNVKGLYHKNVFSTNFYSAWSSTPLGLLPQLDRLNDDASEQSWRDITPWHPVFPQTMGTKGDTLTNSPIFDPRLYALRRLVDFRPDNLDGISVVQFDWNQRFQTKRGYPGLEHTVDFLTVDLSASFFPRSNADNFGEQTAFLEAFVQWNVGDNTGIVASAWFDPFDTGTRYWTIGTYLNRDDRTSFYLGYRDLEPVNSKTAIASVNYVFSTKYSMTAATVFDFGTQASVTNSIFFTRTGTDLTFSIGVNYNYLVNNFGVNINVYPNLFGNRAAGPGNSQFRSR